MPEVNHIIAFICKSQRQYLKDYVPNLLDGKNFLPHSFFAVIFILRTSSSSSSSSSPSFDIYGDMDSIVLSDSTTGRFPLLINTWLDRWCDMEEWCLVTSDSCVGNELVEVF